jgi:hypothetical protein
MSHTPQRRYASSTHNSVAVDALPTLLPATVSRVGVLPMDPASSWCIRVGAVAPTAAAQRAALVELYIATNGNTWSDNNGWRNHTTGSDPCDNTWSGLTCLGIPGTANRNV